jgi:fibronectin-binding autotransporter adhesin
MTGAITLAYAVNKSGNGTWTLAGASSYTTAATISAGRLVLSDSLTSAVTATTGILAPQGTPATTSSISINSTGRLEARPGDTLTVGGSVTLAGNLDVIAPARPRHRNQLHHPQQNQRRRLLRP